jgi:hypothetical protein
LPRLAWSGDLTAEHIGQLAASPARKQIIERLLSGQSAVWVLLESGDKASDDAAAAQLEKSLAEMQRTLKLPDKKTIENDESFKPGTKIELRLEFSVVRIPHQRGNEALFAATLLAGDPDVAGKPGPVALAVFGRGRSYYALAGKDISAEGIEEHCRFLTGDCSCEVKAQNPGFDVLLAADWQHAVMGSSRDEVPPSELRGIGDLAVMAPGRPRSGESAVESEPTMQSSAASSTSAPAASPHSTAAPAAPADNSLLWIAGPAAVGLIVVIIGNIWLRRSRAV